VTERHASTTALKSSTEEEQFQPPRFDEDIVPL